jgi:nitroreductase
MIRLLVFVLGLAVGAAAAPVESLPGPVVNAASFALLSNSRYSVTSGFLPDLSAQVLANVLWAMNRAPRLGRVRELYVATADNLYRYAPAAGGLELHRPGDRRYNSGSAFEVGVAAELAEDAGIAVQAGLLAATAFREEHGAAACPVSWAADHANAAWEPAGPVLMAVVFGRAEARRFDTTVAARGSDIGLPDPVTAGLDSFEIVLMGLREDTLFAAWDLSRETVSQLLWAAAGPTPHRTITGLPGLTLPAGLAGYPRAVDIRVAGNDGVGRYSNRRGDSLAAPDHRLEVITGVDRRDELRTAVPVPATAPAYFVISVPDTGNGRARQEAGIAAFQLLGQARALGLAGRLVGQFDRAQSRALARALELPRGLVPVLVLAAGEAVTAAEELPPGALQIIRAASVLRRGEGARVDYLLRVPGPVRVEVFDMLGRPVRQLAGDRRTAGYHSIEWDGNSDDGVRVKPGNYIIGVFGPGSVAQHKLSVL